MWGKVVLTSAIVQFSKTDDELAVLLGHELAHHTQGHLTNHLVSSIFIAVAAAAVNAYVPGTMGSVQQIGQAFYNHYNQSQELAADAVGLQYAAAAGYDPRVGALLFERMAIEVPQSLTVGFFSSHPSSPERVDAAQKRIEVLIAQGYGAPPVSSPVAAIASGTVPPSVTPPVVSSVVIAPVAQPSLSSPVQTFVPVSYSVPNAATPTPANVPAMYNSTPAVDIQLRIAEREFRAGRIGIDEYRQMKKVLQGE